jgi:sodium-coupled monocarboxylate transporter 8/12
MRSRTSSADIVPLLLMQPPEVYKFGGSYLLMSISLVVAAIANICIYLPVFYNAEIYTVYSYLEKRFDKRIKVLVSVFFVITNILFVSIVIYIVGLTFATGKKRTMSPFKVCKRILASGTKPHIMILVVCLSCIFYTTIGGLKTVVWTDNLQCLVLVVAFVVAFGLGIKSIGGFHTLWNSAVDSGHLDIFE